jgi:hypothetical protein
MVMVPDTDIKRIAPKPSSLGCRDANAIC